MKHLTLMITAFCLFTAAYSQKNYPQGIAHIIVIGIDGLSPDGIRMAQTPVMHQMIESGAVKWNVRTVLPSSSSPNWASMIMGAGPELHGITDNDWEKDQYSLPALTRNEEDIFPTIFGVIRKAKPQAEIGAVYHWDGFGRLFEKKAVNYDKHFDSEDSTTNAFTAYLKEKKPLFAFMHLDHVDHAGHAFGHGSAEYYQSVAKADSLIGQVLSAIKAAGIEKNTLLIVTADHGGVGYGHGGATIEEAEIAMIFHGPSVKKGYQVKQQVVTYDLAATIAFALNITPPYVWTGRPVKSAFTGFAEPANFWQGKALLPSPVIMPGKHLYQQAGGLYINSKATVEIKSRPGNDIIRFTTDGSEPLVTSRQYTQPFSIDTTTVVKAKSFDKAGNERPLAIAYYRLVDSTQGHGLQVKFYAGNGWKFLPLYKDLSPLKEWKSYEIALDREQVLSVLPKDSSCFAVSFNGYLQIDTAGEYTFYSSSDDGSKLYIDDKEVVNNDGNHGVVERSGSITLTGGKHAIRVEHYNGEGGFWIDAYYKGPGLTRQLIPANKLYLQY